MRKDDLARLRHMLDASREATSFVQGKSRVDLDRQRMLVLSLVKCIEIVGEAAGRISEETRGAFPRLPWREITAMRNRLIHGYFDVDLDIVWKSVTHELPRLAKEIEEILSGTG
jgi:uncharacterized protein with HEPN domain